MVSLAQTTLGPGVLSSLLLQRAEAVVCRALGWVRMARGVAWVDLGLGVP